MHFGLSRLIKQLSFGNKFSHIDRCPCKRNRDEDWNSRRLIITPSDQTLSTPPHKPPPTAVELVKEVSLPLNIDFRDDYSPSSVCQYKGYTYVGMGDGSMERINPDGSITCPFLKLPGDVVGVIVYQERLHCLADDGQHHARAPNKQSIHVYDLNGTKLHAWKHGDRSSELSGRKLTIGESQIRRCRVEI